ncbi:hypothetical protein PG989_012302 [Apiospora arundinis]
MPDGSASDDGEVIEIVHAPTQSTRLMNLPTEIRWMIYRYMLILTRGTQSFACFPDGYVFCNSLDLSFPWIASLCPDMFHYVVYHSGYRRISLDFVVLAAPLERLVEYISQPYWVHTAPRYARGPGGLFYVGHTSVLTQSTAFSLQATPARLKNVFHYVLFWKIYEAILQDEQLPRTASVEELDDEQD